MRVLWTTASILMLAAAVSACKKKGDDGGAKQSSAPPLKVAVATAEEAEAPRHLVLTGTIVADQRSEVTADTAGKVLSVMVERGQRVKMGAPVVQLDVRTSALAAREAQANLASARAQRELAEQECARTKQLLDQGAITRSEYDRQTTQCTSALQQVSAAEARAQMMAKSVADGIVRAPFDGVVAQKSVAPGEFVAPGRPLFTLVDDDPLKIEISVPEAEVPSVRDGQEVELRAVAVPDQAHKAKITRIGAEVGRTRALIVEATVTATADGAMPAELKPGMFAEVRIEIGKVRRPVVPRQAVVRRGKTQHVFVVVDAEARDGRPAGKELRDQIVQIAPAASAEQWAIVQGLGAGEKVAVIDAAKEAKLAQGIEDLKKQIAGLDKAHRKKGKEGQRAEAERAHKDQVKALRAQIEALEQQQVADGRRVE
jgi:membrane fusion protein (multidrug efflux system)